MLLYTNIFYDKYKEILRDIIKKKVIYDFTIHRINNSLIPYNDDLIKEFIKDNIEKIENVIIKILNILELDNELETLKNSDTNKIYNYINEEINSSNYISSLKTL